MRRQFGFLGALLAVAISGSASLAVGPRIVSMNVCSDQLLLTLADPDQILGLSRFSRDGWQSAAAGDIGRYPILSGGAEDVLAAKPDIVVASLFDKRSTRELLKEQGLHVVEFAVPRNLGEVKDQIREMGEIAGHSERASAQIARLDAAMARARTAVADSHYRVLQVSRRGWVSGRDSLIGSLLTSTGLFNATTDLGLGEGGFATLEDILRAKPDFLLVSRPGDIARDNGEAFLLHPALERFYPPNKRMVIPERLTGCGSAMLADALDVLTAELRRVSR